MQYFFMFIQAMFGTLKFVCLCNILSVDQSNYHSVKMLITLSVFFLSVLKRKFLCSFNFLIYLIIHHFVGLFKCSFVHSPVYSYSLT